LTLNNLIQCSCLLRILRSSRRKNVVHRGRFRFFFVKFYKIAENRVCISNYILTNENTKSPAAHRKIHRKNRETSLRAFLSFVDIARSGNLIEFEEKSLNKKDRDRKRQVICHEKLRSHFESHTDKLLRTDWASWS